MPAGYSDIFLEQGTTYTNQITLDDDNGNPYDLNGFTVKCQAKKSYYSKSVVINFDASIPDASNGVIQLSANSAVTLNVSAGKLVYDVRIIDTANNIVSRVLEGQIFVSPCVTT